VQDSELRIPVRIREEQSHDIGIPRQQFGFDSGDLPAASFGLATLLDSAIAFHALNASSCGSHRFRGHQFHVLVFTNLKKSWTV
jgi:hypothetical protein